MASSLIGSLRVALGLDTAQFEAGAQKSRSIARGLSKDIESSFKSAKIAVEGLVAAFAIGALTEQIKQSLQYAAAIGETASTLGVTTKQLQEFRFAATQTGVAQEQLEGGLQRLTISMGKAEVGSQAQIKAFNAIGISVDQLKGKNTGQLFEMVAEGLKNVTDRAQRAAVEVALFGKGGAQLDSLLSGGVARLNALGQAAQQLGVVLSDQQIQNAEVTAHKLEALKTVLEANIASTVTDNANSILSLASALSSLTNQILHFFSSNPQLALGIIGGLAGSRFGVAGAALGAAGGALLGERVGQNAADQNMDLRFRIKELQKARDEVNARRAATADTGSLISFRRGSGKAGDVNAALDEFKRQKALLDQATAAALHPQGPPLPGVNLPPFLAPKPDKGKKPPADRSDELLAQMDKEILQANQQILQAKQSLAGSSEEHLAISVQLVQLEKTIKDKAIDEEIAKAERERAEGKITAAALEEAKHKAAILKEANATEAAVKLRTLVEQKLAEHDQDLVALSVQQLKFREDALRTADQLATTQADHRRIQLQILDLEIEAQRLQLESNKRAAILNGLSQDKIDAIQNEIDNLPNARAQQAAVIDRNTRGPLETYLKDIPDTAARINEAFEGIGVNAIDGLIGKLSDLEGGFKHLGATALEEGKQIAQMFLQLALRMLFLRAITGLAGAATSIPSPNVGAAADVNIGSSSLVPGSADFSYLPGFASGGSFMVGGRGGTDMNILSVNGVPRFRVSASETVSVGNGASGGALPSIHMPITIDATGADPAELSRVRGELERLRAEFPYLVVQAYYDAASRNVIR